MEATVQIFSEAAASSVASSSAAYFQSGLQDCGVFAANELLHPPWMQKLLEVLEECALSAALLTSLLTGMRGSAMSIPPHWQQSMSVALDP